MKRICTLFVFIVICSSLKSQFKYGGSLPDSVLTFVHSKSKTLYVGIDNPVKLNLGEDEKTEDYILFTNNGQIFFDSIQFIVIPARSGLSRLVLMKLNENDTIIVGQRFYSARTIPEPRLQIDTLKFDINSEIPKRLLLAADSISIFISSDIEGSENWFKINRFTIGYIYGGLYKNHYNHGNKFSYETKLVINKLGPGKELIFKVFAEGEGNLIVELPVYRLQLY